MAHELVNDELWDIMRVLLPRPAAHNTSAGCKRLDERRVLTGILFIVLSGLLGEMLRKEMGCGPGMTCWYRARDWQKVCAGDNLHHALLAQLRHADRLGFLLVIADSSSGRVAHGEKTGPYPTARRTVGRQRRLVAGRCGRLLNKPQHLQADRAYGCERYCCPLRQRCITPQIAKRFTGQGSSFTWGHGVVGGRAHARLAASVPAIVSLL